MTGLWIVLALMTAVVLVVLLAPLIRGVGKQGPARSEYDLAVFKDQLAALDRDRDRGLLDDGEAEAARIEIQRRMLAAAGPGRTKRRPRPHSNGRQSPPSALPSPPPPSGFISFWARPASPTSPSPKGTSPRKLRSVKAG